MTARDDYPVMAISCHPSGRLYEDVARALDEIDRLRADNVRLREALTTLQSWDTLTLNADGKSDVCDDAPWAQQVISEALA